MTHATACCHRCGRERSVNPERGIADLCRDCRLVEADLASMHGTPSGYSRHITEGTIACDRCLEAHRLDMAAWRRRKGVRSREERWAAEAAKCGTRSGYKRHRRIGEDPCLDCRLATTQANREYRQRKRKDSAA
jgi:hypothetical protein